MMIHVQTAGVQATAAGAAAAVAGQALNAAHIAAAPAAGSNAHLFEPHHNNNNMLTQAQAWAPLAAHEIKAAAADALAHRASTTNDDKAQVDWNSSSDLPPPLDTPDDLDSQPELHAAAQLTVTTSAGVPVPPAPHSNNDEGASDDFNIDAFITHNHITSKAQLHEALLAVESKMLQSGAAALFADAPTHPEQRKTSVAPSSVKWRTFAEGDAAEEPPADECADAHEEISDADAKTLADGKYALVVVVFFVTLGTSILPWYMGRLDRAVEWIAFGACLSAGVILGAAFSHILVDAREAWETYFCGRTGSTAEYAWAEFITVAVLLLLVTIDSALVKSGIEGDAHGHSHGGGNGAHGHSHAIPQLPADYDPTGEKKRKLEHAANAAAVATAGPHGPAHRHPSDPPHVHHHHAHVHVRATPATEAGQVHVDVHTHADGKGLRHDDDDCDVPPPLEDASLPATAGVDVVVCPPCDDACPPCDDDCPAPLATDAHKVIIHDEDEQCVPDHSECAQPVMASAVGVGAHGRPDFALVAATTTNYGSIDACCSPGTMEMGLAKQSAGRRASRSRSHSRRQSHSQSHSHAHNGACVPATSTSPDSSAVAPATADDSIIESMRGSKRAIGQAYVFFIALAIHSLFDGLSIGSEMSVTGFYALLFAVGGHKLLDGFALGVPVYFARFPFKHTAFALIFCAAMTPIGILIGKASTDGQASPSTLLARAIILSMSCGSFIFISVVELLPAGLMDGKHLLPKMAVTFIGWGVMALLALWV